MPMMFLFSGDRKRFRHNRDGEWGTEGQYGSLVY
jgi:hypothetical protein